MREREGTSPAILLALLLIGPSPAEAATRLCLKVEAPDSERAGFEKLVRAELARHPTHRIVNENCESTLLVQFFIVDGLRYLTARINREVPVRHQLGKDRKAINHRLSRALARVLQRDPVSLAKDITRYSRVQRALNSILKRGHNRYRLELFQALATNGDRAVAVPATAVAISRGADHWQVFFRIYFGGNPSAGIDSPQLQIFAGGDAGLTYELSARNSNAFYFSAAFGAQLLRYDGRIDPQDSDSQISATAVLATVSLRVGARLFRVYDFDMDLFAAGYLPLGKTQDIDSPLIDSYTPSAILGVGVGF